MWSGATSIPAGSSTNQGSRAEQLLRQHLQRRPPFVYEAGAMGTDVAMQASHVPMVVPHEAGQKLQWSPPVAPRPADALPRAPRAAKPTSTTTKASTQPKKAQPPVAPRPVEDRLRAALTALLDADEGGRELSRSDALVGAGLDASHAVTFNRRVVKMAAACEPGASPAVTLAARRAHVAAGVQPQVGNPNFAARRIFDDRQGELLSRVRRPSLHSAHCPSVLWCVV